MSKNNKKSRVNVRTLCASAMRTSRENEERVRIEDDWWEWEYSSQGDDPEASDALKEAVLSRYSAEHWRVIKAVKNPWGHWIEPTGRVLAVFDLISAELWMFHGLSYGERKLYAREAAERIWRAVLDYGDPNKHGELDLIDMLDGEPGCDRDSRDRCWEDIDASCRRYATHVSSRLRLNP